MKLCFIFLLMSSQIFGQENIRFRIRTANHGSRIDQVAVSPDNRYIISSSYDKSVQVRDMESGEFLWEYTVYHGNGRNGSISCFDLNTSGQQLAVAGQFSEYDFEDSLCGRIFIFDFYSRAVAKILIGHRALVVQIKFLKDSNYLVSSDVAGIVILWDLEKGTHKIVRGETSTGIILTIAENEFYMVSSTAIYRYDTSGFPGKPILNRALPDGLKEQVVTACYVNSRKKLLLGTFSRKLVVFAENGILNYTIDNASIPAAIVANNDESEFVTGRSMGQDSLSVYNWTDSNLLRLKLRIGSYKNLVKGICFAKDNSIILGYNEAYSIQKLVFVPGKGYQGIFPDIPQLVNIFSAGLSKESRNTKLYFGVNNSDNKGFSSFSHVFNFITRRVDSLNDRLGLGTRPLTDFGDFTLESGALAPNETRFSQELMIKQYGVKKPVGIIKPGYAIRCYSFTHDTLVLTGGRDGAANLFDMFGNKKAVLIGHTADIFSISEAYNHSYIITCGRDGMIHFWNKDSMSKNFLNYPAISIYFQSFDDWVIWTSEGYFTSTRSGARVLGFQQNKGRDSASRFIPIDVFDAAFNRPDIVFRKLGIDSASIIQLYEGAARNRLKKLGLTDFPPLNPDLLPEVSQQLKKTGENSESCVISFSGIDRRNDLRELIVFNQGTPVHRVNLEGKKQSVYSGAIDVPLSSGKNSIEVVAYNNKGLRSIGERIIINNNKGKKPNLYILAVAIAEYSNKEMRLKYPVKDGRDFIASFIEEKGHLFGEVMVDSFFNEKALIGNLDASKLKMSMAGPNDIVIAFFAGHGFLSTKNEFYFALHPSESNSIEKTGLAFRNIEELISKNKALKKLVLLDACHSGELDESENEIKSSNSTTDLQMVKTGEDEGARGAVVGRVSKPLPSAIILQEMFSDLGTVNGIEVIAATAGNSYALESDRWKNGVFTYSILNGLRQRQADRNRDGFVVLSEIKKWVMQQVFSLTGGKQKPNLRSEVNANDWIIK